MQAEGLISFQEWVVMFDPCTIQENQGVLSNKHTEE